MPKLFVVCAGIYRQNDSSDQITANNMIMLTNKHDVETGRSINLDEGDPPDNGPSLGYHVLRPILPILNSRSQAKKYDGSVL